MKLQHAIILVLCFHPIAYGSAASQEPESCTMQTLKKICESVNFLNPSSHVTDLNRINNEGSWEGKQNLKATNVNPTALHNNYTDRLFHELRKTVAVKSQGDVASITKKKEVMCVIYEKLKLAVNPIILTTLQSPRIFAALPYRNLTALQKVMQEDKRTFEFFAAHFAEDDQSAVNETVVNTAKEDIKNIDAAIRLLHQLRSEQDFAKRHGGWPNGRPFRVIQSILPKKKKSQANLHATSPMY